MPLFELSGGAPRRLQRLHTVAETHERQVAELFWEDLETFAGEPLFPLARRPELPGGGAPDIVALDAEGHVVLVEVTRLVDAGRLAACLDLLGWAQRTDATAVGDLYPQGAARFGEDWQAFTATPAPLPVVAPARLLLVAFATDSRAGAAVELLETHGFPLTVVPVRLHETPGGDRILDVGAAGGTATQPGRPTLLDLLEAGTLQVDEPVVWRRPQLAQQHAATVTARGELRLADGRVFAGPSAACNRLGSGSYNGWECWVVPRLDDTPLAGLRTP
ncbi:hypothetical protein KLP28_00160 [Nocardioidaceae bacterium]|nr:hypothetical protein KLP28_00160 [Nocardioidaceae bacterium]